MSSAAQAAVAQRSARRPSTTSSPVNGPLSPSSDIVPNTFNAKKRKYTEIRSAATNRKTGDGLEQGSGNDIIHPDARYAAFQSRVSSLGTARSFSEEAGIRNRLSEVAGGVSGGVSGLRAKERNMSPAKVDNIQTDQKTSRKKVDSRHVQTVSVRNESEVSPIAPITGAEVEKELFNGHEELTMLHISQGSNSVFPVSADDTHQTTTAPATLRNPFSYPGNNEGKVDRGHSKSEDTTFRGRDAGVQRVNDENDSEGNFKFDVQRPQQSLDSHDEVKRRSIPGIIQRGAKENEVVRSKSGAPSDHIAQGITSTDSRFPSGICEADDRSSTMSPSIVGLQSKSSENEISGNGSNIPLKARDNLRTNDNKITSVDFLTTNVTRRIDCKMQKLVDGDMIQYVKAQRGIICGTEKMKVDEKEGCYQKAAVMTSDENFGISGIAVETFTPSNRQPSQRRVTSSAEGFVSRKTNLKDTTDGITRNNTGYDTENKHDRSESTSTLKHSERHTGLRRKRSYCSDSVDVVKMQLYLECSKEHRGKGAEKLYAEYWGRMATYLSCASPIPGYRSSSSCKDSSLSVSDVSGGDGIETFLDAFLKSRRLRRLHNRLILLLMKESMKTDFFKAALQSHIPSKWKCNVRRKRISPQPVSFIPCEKQEPVVNVEVDRAGIREEVLDIARLQRDFALDSGAWAMAGDGLTSSSAAFYLSRSLAGETTSHRQNFTESGVCLPEGCIPGALAVDPLMRGIATREGLTVSDHAIWLLVVALRQHSTAILQAAVSAPLEPGFEPGGASEVGRTSSGVQRSDSENGRDKAVSLLSTDDRTSRERRILSSFDIAQVVADNPLLGGGAPSSSFSRLTWERFVCSAGSKSLTPVPDVALELERSIDMKIQDACVRRRRLDPDYQANSKLYAEKSKSLSPFHALNQAATTELNNTGRNSPGIRQPRKAVSSSNSASTIGESSESVGELNTDAPASLTRGRGRGVKDLRGRGHGVKDLSALREARAQIISHRTKSSGGTTPSASEAITPLHLARQPSKATEMSQALAGTNPSPQHDAQSPSMRKADAKASPVGAGTEIPPAQSPVQVVSAGTGSPAAGAADRTEAVELVENQEEINHTGQPAPGRAGRGIGVKDLRGRGFGVKDLAALRARRGSRGRASSSSGDSFAKKNETDSATNGQNGCISSSAPLPSPADGKT